MKKSKDQGGLRLVDLLAKQQMLKVTWITKIEEDPLLRVCAYENLYKDLGKLIWQCNLKRSDVKMLVLDIKNFWAQTLLSWCSINYQEPKTIVDVMSQILWYNSNIRVNNKPCKWREWISKGILYVRDLFSTRGVRKNAGEL